MKPPRHRREILGFTSVELIVIVAVLAMLTVMLLTPAMTGNKAKARSIQCCNKLMQVSLAFRQWALDNNDKFPTEVSVTNGGAMESVVAGAVAAVFRVMSNELSTPKILLCPDDKRRIQATTLSKAAPVGGSQGGVWFSNSSNISYFVHLDSDSSTPQMLLLGDDNLLVGGKTTINGVAIKGVPVKSGILSLWTNTPITWSDARHQQKGNVALAEGSVQAFSSSKLAGALRNTGAATNRLVMP